MVRRLRFGCQKGEELPYQARPALVFAIEM